MTYADNALKTTVVVNKTHEAGLVLNAVSHLVAGLVDVVGSEPYAFLDYDFRKSKLGAEFKDVARFAEVDYRDAWRDVRTIQQANGVRYTQEGLSKLKREK